MLKDVEVKMQNQISLDLFYDNFKKPFADDDDRNDNINYDNSDNYENSDNSKLVFNSSVTVDEIKDALLS